MAERQGNSMEEQVYITDEKRAKCQKVAEAFEPEMR